MSSSLKVYCRVDASVVIGTGHVMRMLALASELKQRKAEVIFICAPLPEALSASIRQEFSLITLPALNTGNQTSDALATEPLLVDCDWLVVDHYGLSAEWESLLRAKVGK